VSPFWEAVIILLASLLFGVIIGVLGYHAYTVLFKWILKRKIPKDPEVRKAKFLDGGKTQDIDIREVKKHDDEQSRKFREFEKLRRADANNGTAKIIAPLFRAERLNEGRGGLPFNSPADIGRNEEASRATERDIKKRFNATRPDDL
jgi:hypothetical protein